MNKQDFIDRYLKGESEKYKTEFLKIQEARKCNCKKHYCNGWAMFYKPEIVERTRL